MAVSSPVLKLCEEVTCSICLNYFRDPVIITACGHNFCQECLNRSWVKTPYSCPQCRGTVHPECFRRNQQLANFVEIIKKSSPVEEKGVKRKARVCKKHKKPLKFFCKEDEALICMICGLSQDHKYHKVVPLEEVFQENRVQSCSSLELVKQKRERMVSYKGDLDKESQHLLEQTTEEKQEMIAKFRQLHTFLEEQEKLLLAQVEEVEEEITRNRDQQLARLTEELSSLESLIQEMEGKCQQSADDLQDSEKILHRYEEKEMLETPVTLPLALKWSTWDFCDINHLLEGVMKQLKENLDSGLHLLKANITLDPETAHPDLILSEDQKSIREGESNQALPDNPERFDLYTCVLGCEGFRAGRHFWEVLVGNEEEWSVGVARKSVRRKEDIAFTPEEGFWEVGKMEGRYKASVEDENNLTLSGELKRIRVCLNCTGGRVAFFDADRAALLYEFCGVSFSGETLLPSFWVHLDGCLQVC